MYCKSCIQLKTDNKIRKRGKKSVGCKSMLGFNIVYKKKQLLLHYVRNNVALLNQIMANRRLSALGVQYITAKVKHSDSCGRVGWTKSKLKLF